MTRTLECLVDPKTSGSREAELYLDKELQARVAEHIRKRITDEKIHKIALQAFQQLDVEKNGKITKQHFDERIDAVLGQVRK
jgi:hypothetical protein